MAKHTWVKLCINVDDIVLMVEDDGIGFSSEAGYNHTRGLGIIGMRERAEQLGGKLEISRRQPCGTIVQASMPASAAERSSYATNEVIADD